VHAEVHRSTPSSRSSENDELTFKRNESLRTIIRAAFRAQGVSLVEADYDLSTRLSNKTLKVIEASGGARGAALERRVQLFATLTLLSIKRRRQPTPHQTAEFMVYVMGRKNAQKTTEADFKAFDSINVALNRLLDRPAWAGVHAGHAAMSCVSLLSLCDLSILNWRMP
jgi:hypothetical protein